MWSAKALMWSARHYVCSAKALKWSAMALECSDKALEWSACDQLCFGVIGQSKGVVGYNVQVLQLGKKKEKNKIGSRQRYI